MRQLVYMAHCVSGDVLGNIARAKVWLRWLKHAERGVAFIARWIAALECGEDDSDPEERELGMLDCEATVRRCDGIVLCGPLLSSGVQRENRVMVGMRDLIDTWHAARRREPRGLCWTIDFTRFGLDLPPTCADSNAGALMRHMLAERCRP